MSVYVDDMEASFSRMLMCHMIADTHDELIAMAEKIGVKTKWIQAEGTYREHFDICKSKRALAIKAGAEQCSQMDLGLLIRAKREALK